MYSYLRIYMCDIICMYVYTYVHMCILVLALYICVYNMYIQWNLSLIRTPLRQIKVF